MQELDSHKRPSNKERRQRERKIWRAAFMVSLLLHLLLLLGLEMRPEPPSPFSAAGPDLGDDQAAAGGMQSVTLRNPTPVPVPPPPVLVPAEVEIEPVDFEEDPSFDPASLAGEDIGDAGPGVENGEGQGDAGTAEEGLNRMTPPSPRGMIIPPSSDKLRGTEVEVWVFVDERGRVVADSTHLRPPTSDGDLNRQLVREAAEWVFTPAMRGGEPVATWFPYRISM